MDDMASRGQGFTPLQVVAMIGGGALLVASGAGIAFGASTLRDDSAKNLAELRTAAVPVSLQEISCEEMRVSLHGEPVVTAPVHGCFVSSEATVVGDHQSLRSWLEGMRYKEAHEPQVLKGSTQYSYYRKSDAAAGIATIPAVMGKKAYDRSTHQMISDVRYLEVMGLTWKDMKLSLEETDKILGGQN